MIKPGPRLDALVAEKVMNGVRYNVDRVIAMDVSAGSLTIGGKLEYPEYSTSISAAWEVVEKLKEIKVKGWSTDIVEEIFPINIIWKQDDKEWEVVWSPAYWQNEHSTTAKTLPHAICLAALKAVGVEI